jgi:RecA/RadA recombinase
LLFDPKIPGLHAMLFNVKGFQYYPDTGLSIVIYGPPGSGKTILALQMALRASQDKRVIYFTKDTAARTLQARITGEFKYFGLPGNQINKVQFHFLDEMQSHLLPKPDSSDADEKVMRETEKELTDLAARKSFFAFSNFDQMSVNPWTLDHYMRVRSVYSGLSHLEPDLKYILDQIEGATTKVYPQNSRSKEPELVVVCDALSAAHMEESVRLQGASYAEAHAGTSECKKIARPIMIYVLECSELSKSISAAFPPDVEIRMGIRVEKHGIRTRTIQFLKTRFQKSLDEEAPFIICGENERHNFALKKTIRFIRDTSEKKEHKWQIEDAATQFKGLFSSKPLGIEIMPPLAHETVEGEHVATPAQGEVIFNIKSLDGFTAQKNLAGGGCTLLVTQNRCGSTALSLHYLLGQISHAIAAKDNSHAPKSVLYISFSDDIEEIIHNILRFPRIRNAIIEDDVEVTVELINRLKAAINDQICKDQNGGRKQNAIHRLYMVPLRRDISQIAKQEGKTWSTCPHSMKDYSYLYIYIPDFTWVTAEEALEQVNKLWRICTHVGSDNECAHCCKIGRIVFDRVGRLQARWPLVDDCVVFVSNMVAMCSRHNIELMLVDDTADDENSSGNVHSRWISVAQNVIRLRRVSIHGSETTTIELVNAAGRIVKQSRPYELSFSNSSGGYNDEILIEDNFAGYTGLLTPNPRRCTLKVDLSYDEEQTPLHSEVIEAKHTIEDTMDDVEVRTIEPGTWAGINSAFNNLSGVSRDSCHVVAIDGIWLRSLIEDHKLHRFQAQELHTILPSHIEAAITNVDPSLFESNTNQSETNLAKEIDKLYVTHTVNTAYANIHYLDYIKRRKSSHGKSGSCPASTNEQSQSTSTSNEGVREAIPLRHNWGVLAVVKPSGQYLRSVFSQIFAEPPSTSKTASVSSLTNDEIIAKIRQIRGRIPVKHPNGVSENKIDDTVMSMLFGDRKDGGTGLPQETSNIYKSIWTDAPAVPTWEELANFRTDYWQPFWSGGWIEDRLLKAMQGIKPVDPTVLVFPRIDFFGLAMTSTESLVSFLLELLYTQVDYDQLFDRVPYDSTDDCALLLFNTKSAKCKEGFVDALILLYRLLSPSSRRRIVIGFRAARTDTGVGVREQLIDDKSGPFNAWPRQIALFSRQWITTVPNLMPCHDIREAIKMLHLPGGGDNTASYWNHMGNRNKAENYGIPVAGTWYLGVLKGGNASMGVNVIKEIVSEDHERQRFLSRCGAPVSKRFYEEQPQGQGSEGVPYLDVIQKISKQGNTTPLIFFPFHRTQIVDYQSVTLVLYDLIRNVMRCRIEDTEYLTVKHKPGFGGLHPHVEKCVTTSFSQLEKLREDM